MSTAASKTTDYDLIVIGGGAVGENVADYATQQGLQVAIVESELVGGECSYWACMPSKALLRSGNALRAARRLPGTREAVTGELDVRAVLERRTTFTSGWKDDGQAKWVESAGIELIRGHATVTGAGQVKVDGRMYTARAVALATGSVPHIPEIDGLAEAQPWGTREATSAKTVPQRLIVLGGGVAGTEMAFAFSSLGAHVTVLSRSALLSHEEPFVGECLADALTAEGVDVRIGATPSHIDRDAEGLVTATLEDGSTIQADEILVATGRTPATDGLGLDSLGLGGNEGLAVDDTMLVKGTDWLYAVGDVNGRALLTHQGKYQARAAGEAIAARLNGTQVQDQP
ncbi:MAG: FAD-dependent oxidoreductase, partial [Ancrocorticia populi]